MADYQSRQYLQSLTPLRGLAAIWVVIYHYTFQYFPSLHPEYYTGVVGNGYLAVDMFFILSGFVMAHVYHGMFLQDVGSNYLDFLKARVARLYPVHLLILGLFVATSLAARAAEYAATGTFEMIPLEGARSLSALFANLFMLQGLRASDLSWNYPAWSISVEFIAYLVFPLALPTIWRAGLVSKAAMTGAIVAAIGWLALLTKDNFNQWDGPLTLLRCLPEFLLGSLLYIAYRRGVGAQLLRHDAVAIGLIGLTFVLLHRRAADLAIVLLFAVLVLSLVGNRGVVAAALNARPLVWLGEISYSLYLLHGLVQYVTTRVLVQGFDVSDRGKLAASTSFLLTAGMVTVTVGLATMTYRYVEVPGRRFVRQAWTTSPRRSDAK